MRVSLIIPVYNAEDTITLCLEYILKQEKLPDQVILIDNNSTDKSLRKMEIFKDSHPALNILLLHEAKRGAAAARNKGLLYAEGDIIVFTDSDCLPRRDWIKNITGIYEKNSVDALGGITYIYNPHTFSAKLEALDLTIPEKLRAGIITEKYETLFGKIIGTFNGSYRKKVFEETGGFDESLFIAGEDVDLTIRAFEKGFKILVWHPDVVVEHKPRKSFALFLKKIFQYRSFLPVLVKKHFRKQALIEIPGAGVRKIPFFTCAVVTTEFLLIVFSLFLLILCYRTIFISVLTGVMTLFAARLTLDLLKRKRMNKIKISFWEFLGFVWAEVIKKAVSESGKIYGSLKNHAIYV